MSARDLRLFESASFAVFWKAYPLKTHRLEALTAWRKLGDDPTLHAAIMKDLETREWRVIDGRQVVPNPATYLNKRRWEDERNSSMGDSRGCHSGRADVRSRSALSTLRLAASEALALTPEQRAANIRKLRQIVESIKI